MIIIALTVTIDGREVVVRSGTTVLEAAREAGVEIPTMCHSEWVGPATHCMVCVVSVVEVGVLPACHTRVWHGMEIETETEAVRKARQGYIHDYLTEHYADCVAPCSVDCPSDIDVQGYIQLIRQGKPRAAIDLIRDTNPFPAVCGRVCTHPCEEACRRQAMEDPVAIRALKRYAADIERSHPLPPRPGVPNGKSVAVVGAGPAGLTAAYHLARRGYEVQVYDAGPEPGGMLRYGIPAYRLPREDLDHDINYIKEHGVALHQNQLLGEDLTLDSLRANHDAVFVSVGASKGIMLDFPGADLPGVWSGLDFLDRVNSGEDVSLGRKVAVIGGGNTAFDAARTALRTGAEEVSIVYRRTEDEMPAEEEEIEDARDEGIAFYFLASPVACRGEERVQTLEAQQMELGEPDASGRPRPVPIEGAMIHLDVDAVIMAIGQNPDLSCLQPQEQETIGASGRIEVAERSFATALPDVFAGGDAVRGAATVVEAIGDGLHAADAIDRRLSPETAPEPSMTFNIRRGDIETLVPEEFEDVPSRERASERKIAPGTRKKHFDEVNRGLEAEDASCEASRCLECGCKAADDCTLRNLAECYELSDRDVPIVRHYRPTRTDHPFIEHDPNRCIACGQCVRVCADVVGVSALAVTDRVGLTGDAQRLEETMCESCGLCVTACPTGALVARTRTVAAAYTRTTCPYCGVGCGLLLGTRAGEIVDVRAEEDHPVNRGQLCVKGRFGFDFVTHPDRLTRPLIRRDGRFEEISWDEALSIAADKLREYADRDEVGVFGSAKCTTEEMYALQKLTRAVLGTNNIDHCARLCHAPSVSGLNAAFGSGAMSNSINDVLNADCILSIGSNTTESHPVMGYRVKQAVASGTTLIVANPMWIDLCRYADLWLRHRPGTDVALLSGMAKVIMDENLHDHAFIAERCAEFDEFVPVLESVDLDRVEEITGVSREDIAAAARAFAAADASAILYAMGITQHSHGTENVMSIANLALLTGNMGRPGTGVNPLRGQNNVQGACDMAVLPNVLPGYQSLEGDRAGFERAYDTDLPETPGLTMTEMIKAAEREDLRALYIVGENPLMSEADVNRTRRALESLDFLIVQDIFLNETAELADLVLPAASFAEKDGTFVNTERRVQRVRRALDAPGDARTDLDIICALARKLEAFGFDWEGPEEVMEEIASLVPSWAGINYERIEHEGLAWPCPDPEHSGTEILYREQFSREDGRARFSAVEYEPSRELPDGDYPLVLTTGRTLRHFHTGTMTRRVEGLERMQDAERVRIHPVDATRYGIADGAWMRVSSRRGEVEAEARVTREVPEGTIFMTFHFVEANANVLTNPELDPAAKIPEYKVCAVRVEPAAS